MTNSPYSNSSNLGLNISNMSTYTAAGSVYTPATNVVDRRGFYEADIIIPSYISLANTHSVALGLGVKESDTSSAAAAAASLITLVTPVTIVTGITTPTGNDVITTFGVDLRSRKAYCSFVPIVTFSASTIDTIEVGEIVQLQNPIKQPMLG